MEYWFYSATFFIFLIFTSAALITRHRWVPILQQYSFLGGDSGGSFFQDVEDGFQSSTFDLRENIENSDSRAGLDTKARRAIKKIMITKKLGFDAARLEYVRRAFRNNDIGPDGTPLDPRAVTFS